MKPVVIVGNSFLNSSLAPFEKCVPYSDADSDIWAFNTGAMRKPRITAAFQMHEPNKFFDKNTPAALKANYLDWLQNLNNPVYMRKHYEEYPTSIAYPFQDAFALTQNVRQGLIKLETVNLFCSSVDWAIALGILQERKRIDIYGVEMGLASEYEQQRGSYLFWVGLVAGRGIELNIHCGDSIFRKPIYGASL
jgi:hypothetical protein